MIFISEGKDSYVEDINQSRQSYLPEITGFEIEPALKLKFVSLFSMAVTHRIRAYFV